MTFTIITIKRDLEDLLNKEEISINKLEKIYERINDYISDQNKSFENMIKIRTKIRHIIIKIEDGFIKKEEQDSELKKIIENI